MKLTQDDNRKLRTALLAARLAGVNDVVITNGIIAGVHEQHIGAIFSPIDLSIDKDVTIGIKRLTDLEKRLSLFGENIEVEIEINDAKKARKLGVRASSGKIEFRCTDERLITYPKTNQDEPGMVLTLTKAEIGLISKGAKTLGTEQLTLQIKRDGVVHVECSDANTDRFEVELAAPAEFVDDVYPYVNPFDVSSKGVFIPLLENLVKDADTAEIVVMRSGNISIRVYGHDVLAVPRIQTGE